MLIEFRNALSHHLLSVSDASFLSGGCRLETWVRRVEGTVNTLHTLHFSATAAAPLVPLTLVSTVETPSGEDANRDAE